MCDVLSENLNNTVNSSIAFVRLKADLTKPITYNDKRENKSAGNSRNVLSFLLFSFELWGSLLPPF